MIASIFLALQAFEGGFWLGQVGWKRRQRERTHDQLVWGRRSPTKLFMIDDQLKKLAGTPTKTQARVANGVVKTAQWLTHTRAFELMVLKAVRERWPKGKQLNANIKLSV